MKQSIRVAIAGVGNCASALVQGLAYYQSKGPKHQEGLVTPLIGPYAASDISIVAAFDVDARKVGIPLEQAIFAEPNCASKFAAPPPTGVIVKMAPPLDGIPSHMKEFPTKTAFRLAETQPVDVVKELIASNADVLLCYVPVGAEAAARHYASACLDTRVTLINCMPAFLASDPHWGERFRSAGIPLLGDDIKSQIGATVVHQALTRLIVERGCTVSRSYQVNVGGNTDFLNMLARDRVASKIRSKVGAIQSQLAVPLPEHNIHAGPSDYVPWLLDNKIAFIRIEGLGFGGMPIELDVRLSVHDSPNSAAIAIDLIRIAKLAMNSGISGPLEDVCAYYMKSPPRPFSLDEARERLDAFMRAAAVTR